MDLLFLLKTWSSGSGNRNSIFFTHNSNLFNSMSAINYMTAEGLKKLKQDLDNLVKVERPAISKQIGEAIEKGDISENAEITIEEGVTINESNNIALKKNGQFIIGKNTYITRATIACYEKIEIGENCILGEGMKIFDHNHQYTTEPFSVSKTEFNTAPVKLGNNVWTGANCIILKGVTIGDNVILGAGCVIHKDIPANSIVINKQELVIKPL